jgi:hypothetical protein
VEMNEFHWTDGWYFKRNDDGSVRIRKRTISTDDAPIIAEATIPALEWVSIASHCTAGGEGENYQRVKDLVIPFKHYPTGMGDESRRLHREYLKLVRAQEAGAKNGPEVVRLTDECAAKGIILVPGGENL